MVQPKGDCLVSTRPAQMGLTKGNLSIARMEQSMVVMRSTM
jgi:hypothetical protein